MPKLFNFQGQDYPVKRVTLEQTTDESGELVTLYRLDFETPIALVTEHGFNDVLMYQTWVSSWHYARMQDTQPETRMEQAKRHAKESGELSRRHYAEKSIGR